MIEKVSTKGSFTFRHVRPADRGILQDLLTRSYQPLKELNEYPWIPDDDTWQVYDDKVFDQIEEGDEHIFLTTWKNEVVGFASFGYDQNTATIGRNSVIPEAGGQGIGTAQVREIIRRCRRLKIPTIEVQTGTHPFFIPAQKMYLNAGFEEIDRFDDGNDVGRMLVKYRLTL